MKKQVLAAAVLAGFGIGPAGCGSFADRGLTPSGQDNSYQPPEPAAAGAPFTPSPKPEKKNARFEFQPERTREEAKANKKAKNHLCVRQWPLLCGEVCPTFCPL